MKLTLTILAYAGLMGVASAYTITVSNQSNVASPDLPILDNTGTPISSGSIGVGFFGSDDDIFDNSQDFAALLSTFNEYGATTAIQTGFADGLVNNVTPPEWTVVVPNGTTGGQVGQDIYVIFGNGSTLAESDALAIFRSDTIFETDDDLGNGGAAVSVETGSGDLLLGTLLDETVLTAGAGSITFENGIQLVTAVPEPSSSLLAGLAGLALLARRRR